MDAATFRSIDCQYENMSISYCGDEDATVLLMSTSSLLRQARSQINSNGSSDIDLPNHVAALQALMY